MILQIRFQYNLAIYRVVNLSKFFNADYETIIPKTRSSSSTKGKDAVYDSRVENPLPSIEYNNEEENNINNIDNQKKYV